MPLKKLLFRPGVNRENTRYTTEGGFYDCDKVRFRQGTPEKIGGWTPLSVNTFLGVCRSLWTWITLAYVNLIGIGTHLKFYISRGGNYYDITPIRAAITLNGPFAATNGSPVVTVTDVDHGCINNDFVTFNGAVSLGGAITAAVLNQEYQITFVDTDTYTINVGVNATAGDSGNGGSSVRAVYQINTGPEFAVPQTGWGAGPWGFGTWGFGQTASDSLRLWSQSNYGQDLIFGPRGGGIYYWSPDLGVVPVSVTITTASPAVLTANTTLTSGTPIMFQTTGSLPTGLLTGIIYYVRNAVTVAGVTTFNVSSTPTAALVNTSAPGVGTQSISPRGINLTAYPDASDVPVVQNIVFVSDIFRFVFAFGANDYTSTVQDPLLVRWSDQEDAYNWTPAATTQAGSLKLSSGSEIIAVTQTRQEIVVFTDNAVYSMQYLGPPYVWNAQLLADNISIEGQNCVAVASGIVYWMGVDKFYKYDGRVQTLRCDLRQYIFGDINQQQAAQIFAGTSEGFNEIWWFYCSAGSNVVNRYVIYNYLEDIWYYGTLGRTAWLDINILDYPLAATYSNTLVYHENGLDDNVNGTSTAINSYITSSEFDIEDGHNFGFIWRIVPDITFRGSTAASPQATMTLLPLKSSGSGYTNPPSVGGSDSGPVVRTATVPVEAFTQYVYVRVRGRQIAFKIESSQLGTTWQLGAPRIDIKPDGRR
jgi:hypothetical protein